ncbi:MAG TPA: hypothetical protein VFX58_07100, partial [Chitinophagaceae bacterium]|nr:hypothetical protein [Chitinophagaceae bacterium]
MKKSRLQISVVLGLLLVLETAGQNKYPLFIRGIDKDSSFLVNEFGIPSTFDSRLDCIDFINKLPGQLNAKGYVTASIDSLRYDSLNASMVLFLGDTYRWARLDASTVDPGLLEAVGWRDKSFTEKAIDFTQVSAWQERILNYLENNGHPFARVYLDSLQLEGENVSARLRVEQGPAYKIDSIRVFGDAKISNDYLQRYLDISNGSLYDKRKLGQVGRKIRELTYIQEEQPSNLTLLGTGSVLNLYLKQKKSSQVNVLVGFLPNNDQLSSKKLLITGEANILLKNALGAGETIGLNWQQLQVKSPRLNLLF